MAASRRRLRGEALAPMEALVDELREHQREQHLEGILATAGRDQLFEATCHGDPVTGAH